MQRQGGDEVKHKMKLLEKEFKRIKLDHNEALKATAARVVLGSSVIRVFQKGTKEKLMSVLARVGIDGLCKIKNQRQFKLWFEKELNKVAVVVRKTNRANCRIYPGYKWGHSTKVLTLHIREMVLKSRYFKDKEVKRISSWLYTPIDSIAIKRLRKLGVKLPFNKINDIRTPKMFYGAQDILAKSAIKANVPRIWFDDNWGYRIKSKISSEAIF